jgi:hypothetical protein
MTVEEITEFGRLVSSLENLEKTSQSKPQIVIRPNGSGYVELVYGHEHQTLTYFPNLMGLVSYLEMLNGQRFE